MGDGPAPLQAEDSVSKFGNDGRGAVKRAVVLAAGLLFGAGAATAQTTLAEALANAYVESGLIEQNRAVLRAADEDVAQAVAALRPVVSWSSNIRRSFGTTGADQTSPLTGQTSFVERSSVDQTTGISLAAELVLYDAGNRRLNIDLSKESVLATRADLVSVEQQVLLRAVQAFMEVRRALDQVELRQNNTRVITQELRAARERFEVGEVTRTDVALAEARLSGTRSALAAAQGQLEQARAEYEAAVGDPPGGLVAPQGLPSIPPSIEQAQRIALANHPDLEAVQHNVTAAELGVMIAETASKPRVSLRGEYGITENFDNDDYSRSGTITLGASGPIYQGGALPSQVRRARAQRDQARAGLINTSRAIEQRVTNAYASLRVARASIQATRDQVRAASVAFDGVREEATLGQRTTLDVLDAEQELLDARNTLISAQVDETIAAYAVLSAIGELTARSLQLNVPIYDPSAYYSLVKDAPAGLSSQGRELDRVLEAIGR